MSGLCQNSDLITLIGYIQTVLNLIKIGIPIALIVWGSIDLGKAVVASDEKKIKENQQILMKRAVAAVLVFLLSIIVGFVMGVVGGQEWKTCWDAAAAKCPTGAPYNPNTGQCCVVGQIVNDQGQCATQ